MVVIVRQRRLQKRSECAAAFTWKELLALVVVIGVLVGVLAPAMTKTRMRTQRIGCVSNLKNIGLGYRIYATDNSEMFPWERTNPFGVRIEPVLTNRLANFWIISNSLSTPKILVCRAETERSEALSWRLTASNVSYFVNLRASEALWEMPMVGDDNLLVNGAATGSGVVRIGGQARVKFDGKRHVRQGNMVLSDGSVQQLSQERLESVVDAATSGGTNLLFDLP